MRPTPATVLVVDDEPVVRALLRAVLEPAGSLVFEAADGNEAIEKAWRERPDVVLLDVGLPMLSGLDVCRALRTNPNPPAVILMSGDNIEDTDVAACGASGAMRKPFVPKIVFETIDRVLESAAVA